MLETILLIGFAFLAGFIDSIVGGGGLIQLPGLLAVLGESYPFANLSATNKLASISGTSVATVQYARKIKIDWQAVLPTAITAGITSFLGARIVSLLDREVLRPIIIGLLIAVAIYTFIKKDFGAIHAPKLTRQRQLIVGLAAGAILGFYDGFFGPGTGSFLILIFITVFGYDFLTASASAKVVNLATNSGAVLLFLISGQILWAFAIPMAVSQIVGSVVGTRMAMLKGSGFVRVLFLVVVSGLIVYLIVNPTRRLVYI